MSLVVVNTLILLWQKVILHGAPGDLVYKYYGLIPKEFTAAITTRWDLLPYNLLTIFTSMFLHGGFLHLGGNMLYLWIFGNNIEDALGHTRFLFFYLLSGVIAAAFQFFYDPASAVPMIGASGAVSGILGAYLVLYPHARIKTILIIIIFIKVVEIPAILLLTLWFFMQLLYSNMEGVAWYAHIGGFIFGLATVKLLSRKRRPPVKQKSGR